MFTYLCFSQTAEEYNIKGQYKVKLGDYEEAIKILIKQ